MWEKSTKTKKCNKFAHKCPFSITFSLSCWRKGISTKKIYYHQSKSNWLIFKAFWPCHLGDGVGFLAKYGVFCTFYKLFKGYMILHLITKAIINRCNRNHPHLTIAFLLGYAGRSKKSGFCLMPCSRGDFTPLYALRRRLKQGLLIIIPGKFI